MLVEMNIDMLFAVKAEEYLAEGKIDQAIEICQMGLEKFPNYISAYGVLARALYEAGLAEDAEQIIEQAKHISPFSKTIKSFENNSLSIFNESYNLYKPVHHSESELDNLNDNEVDEENVRKFFADFGKLKSETENYEDDITDSEDVLNPDNFEFESEFEQTDENYGEFQPISFSAKIDEYTSIMNSIIDSKDFNLSNTEINSQDFDLIPGLRFESLANIEYSQKKFDIFDFDFSSLEKILNKSDFKLNDNTNHQEDVKSEKQTTSPENTTNVPFLVKNNEELEDIIYFLERSLECENESNYTIDIEPFDLVENTYEKINEIFYNEEDDDNDALEDNFNSYSIDVDLQTNESENQDDFLNLINSLESEIESTQNQNEIVKIDKPIEQNQELPDIITEINKALLSADKLSLEEIKANMIEAESEGEQDDTIYEETPTIDYSIIPISESLAEIYEHQGYFDEAIVTYQKLIELNPSLEAVFSERILAIKEEINTYNKQNT